MNEENFKKLVSSTPSGWREKAEPRVASDRVRKGIPIKFPNLLDGKERREGFFVKEESNVFWLCHLTPGGEDGNGFVHCIPISESLYNKILKENE